MTNTPFKEVPLLGGVHRKYHFDNGYGASVVRHDYSYGGSDGFWELAVLGQDGHLTYDTPITDDVIGYLTDEQVQDLLSQIESLPKP
jgi:hypothetical protein